MPEARPSLQKHHSSSSVSQTGGRSPGAGSRHVVGGARARLGARVPSYARNVNKLAKLTQAHPGQKAVLPRNGSKSNLRKNKSETALHRRNRSSTDFSVTAGAHHRKEKHSTHRASSEVNTSPENSGGEEVDEVEEVEDGGPNTHKEATSQDTIRPPTRSQNSPVPLRSNFSLTALAPHGETEVLTCPDDSQSNSRSRNGMANWDDNVAESFDFEADRRVIEQAAREPNHKPTNSEENVLPLRPYPGLAQMERVKAQDAAQEADEISGAAEVAAREQIHRGKQPLATPEDRRVKFTIGDDKTNIEGVDNATGALINTPVPTEPVTAPQGKSITRSSTDETLERSTGSIAESPTARKIRQSQFAHSSTPPSAFNIQSNLDRDRIKTMQPEYAVPPSAWKSHRLIEVTPHLTDAKSEYTAKFMNRWDREIDKKLESLKAIRDPLAESWDRIMRGTHLFADNERGVSDQRDGEEDKKKPEASSASLTTWFGGLTSTTGVGKHDHVESSNSMEEDEEDLDDEDWLRDMHETLDDLEEIQSEFVEQFRSVLNEKFGRWEQNGDDDEVDDEEEVYLVTEE